MRILISVILFLSSVNGISQTRLFLKHKDAISYYDHPSKSFVIIDDSTFYWRYEPSKKKWVKESVELDSTVPFDLFLKFVPLSKRGSRVYFIYPGCGLVYEKIGDKIKRVDLSFLQKNQLGGPIFLYRDKPHIFGGYGLFSYKNFITYFEPFSKEWFKLKTTGKLPPPSQLNNVCIFEDKLYVFNGFDMTTEESIPQRKVYCLDLIKNSWRISGHLNPKICLTKMNNSFLNSEYGQNNLHVFNKDLITYDFKKNQFIRYHLEFDGVIRQIIKNNNELLVVFKNTGSENNYAEIESDNFLKKFKQSTGKIYLPILEKSHSFSITILSIIFSISFLIWLILNNRKRRLKHSILNKHDQTLTFLNVTELELLLLFIRNPDGIDINLLNEIISYGEPSIDTLKKRREYLLKEFKLKLSDYLKINSESVILEKRMSTDKRMKVFYMDENHIAKIKSDLKM